LIIDGREQRFSPVDGTTTINELVVHYEVTFGVSISISVQEDHEDIK
jgi:hypothetical protein